jgi:regulator of sigma E protease
MGTIIGTIFAFLIVFGVLVFIHEFGHFFMAKLVGIRVEVFSFGYGKRLFGIKKGDTDYRISLLPMGGYVRMLGEGMFETGRELAPDDMMSKNRGQRFLVMVMGSVMNILLAIALVALINGIGVPVAEYQDQKPVIGHIDPGSPAERADIRPDDEILAINGRKVSTWNDVEIAVGSKPGKVITLDVARAGQVFPVELKTESVTQYEMGYAGFKGKILTQIRMVTAGSPAEKSGLKPGDVITTVDGSPVYFYSFIPVIEKHAGTVIRLGVARGAESLEIPVIPKSEGGVGKIGILQEPKSVVRKYGFFGAIGESVNYNLKNFFLVIRFIKDLFSGQASTRQLGGPLEIANFSYAAFRMGWLAMISWIAIISLQLGVMNLLPIPVLDGGQIFVLAVESLFRRDFSVKARQIWMQIGFVMFAFMIAFVILNDFVKKLPHGWGSLLPF